MDKILQQISSWMGEIHSSIPYVKVAVLQTTSIDCVATISYGILLLLFGLCFMITALRTSKWALAIAKKEFKDYYALDTVNMFWTPYCSIPVFCIGVASILSLVGIIIILNFWTWYGIWHPDLYLIHQAINKITN